MRIAREGWPFAVPLLVATPFGAWAHPLAGAGLGLLAGYVIWFFRDPERRTPADPAGLISPADGKVLRIAPQRISIFLNIFDVHVCRTPMGGTIRRLVHHPGRFLAAWRDEASEQNERVVIDLETAHGTVRCTLVAGLVARRIVCKVREGQALAAGERVGLIRFGSRVDLELPADFECVVAIGQRVRAGETLLARASLASSSRFERPGAP